MKKFNPTMSPYYIAEVGQNHNGDIEEAIRYVKKFAGIGANCVKFQTRNNKYLFSKEAYEMPYNSDNAFGDSYGEHREALELSKSDLLQLKSECKKFKVDFMSTPFDEPSIDLLMDIDVDLFKVASFDLGNLVMLKHLVETKKPIVLSIGGGKSSHIDASLEFLLNNNADFSVLHCVSQYPCPPEDLRLGNIQEIIKKYPNVCVGSSDHFNGILSGPIAYILGARVFEKHVTLNRSQKGTDQSFSLEAKGFEDLIRDIERVDLMIDNKEPKDIGNEPVFKKLGKSLIALQDIQEGEEFTFNNISGKIFSENSVPVRETHKFIGKTSNTYIKAGKKLSLDHIS